MPRRPRQTILVVDDNPDTREALARLLHLRGHAAIQAADGADALAFLREGTVPSVIVLDLLMPRVDGEQFLRSRAADPVLASIPVVVYSAVATRRRMPGVLSVVRKAAEPDTLLDAIDAALQASPGGADSLRRG